MPESVIRPDADHEQDLPTQPETPREEQNTPREKLHESAIEDDEPTTMPAPAKNIIWTPAFLLIFVLTLVIGISVESLLTQVWENKSSTGQGIILAHIILAALGWLGLGIVTHSRWIRVGCIFGGIWAVFMGLNIFTNAQGIDPSTPVQSYINVAICMALLGASTGLSVEGTLLTSWDTWLFLLVPILSALGVTLTYFLTPLASIVTVENAIAASALIASCLFWWLRPSCWKKRPGPTFLFGLVPAILLIMAMLNASMHDFFQLQVTNIHTSPAVNSNTFFFVQVSLLCLLLGCVRMIKGEKVQ
jgi:hypothetical protein